MRPDRLLLSCIHLILVLFLIALGLFIAILPQAPVLCHAVAAFLLSDTLSFYLYLMGAIVLLVALFFMVGFHQLHKRRYYKIAMKGAKILIEESIIRDYIKEYWSQLFPDTKVPVDVVLSPRQKIEIIAEIPSSEETGILERIENELGVLLARKLGYEKEFTLTILSP